MLLNTQNGISSLQVEARLVVVPAVAVGVAASAAEVGLVNGLREVGIV